MPKSKNLYNKQLADYLTDAFEKEGYSSSRARDLAFHLVDWQDDLETIYNLYKNYKKINSKKALTIVNGFIIHATVHLLAAHKLAGWGKPKNIF